MSIIIDVNIDDIMPGVVIYAMDKWDSKKVRPYLVINVDEDEKIYAHPITSSEPSDRIDIIIINGRKSYISSDSHEFTINEIDHIEPSVDY